MKGMKILLVIFGILLIIGGIYCIFSPGKTFASLAPVCGAVMIIDAIGDICTWSSRRKAGQADGWSLAGCIISLIFGLLLLCNVAFSFFAETFMLYMFIIWLIIVGIIRIVAAIKLKGFKGNIEAAKKRAGVAGEAVVGKGWGFVLVMGIIMVIIGICGLFNPIVIALGVGLMVGCCILSAGISTLSMAFSIE